MHAVFSNLNHPSPAVANVHALVAGRILTLMLIRRSPSFADVLSSFASVFRPRGCVLNTTLCLLCR
jgi:hypothetical protein